MLMDAGKALLLVIDVQDRLLPVMANPAAVARNTGILLQAARELDVPVIASEQYPKGIGATVADVGAHLPEGAVSEKLHFSCLGDSALAQRLAHTGKDQGRTQVILAGIEAHVCVLQTALDLLGQGYQVFLVADAVSSRTQENAAAAIERLRAAGAVIVTTEMVVFEWLKKAGTPEFKTLSKLVK